MIINTLIIGFVPLTEVVGKKPRAIREDEYTRELLAKFDLGEVYYANFDDWKQKADEIDPLFIILLGNDYYAQEVRSYKKDALIYKTHSASQIFYRKAETESKMIEQNEALATVSGLIKKARTDGEKEIKAMRHFAAMSFDDLYEMIRKAIISDNKKLHDQAWNLLFGKGAKGDFVWMRVKLMADLWEQADGKGKEDLMCLAMEHHVSEGTARKLDPFTDAYGQQFHQYMFCDFFGRDLNYIRRIPFGEKKQEKYAYESLLNQQEAPTNFLQVLLEANQVAEQKKKYFESESAKIAEVLKAWKTDPTKSKRDLGVIPLIEGTDQEPLTEEELNNLKGFLEKYNKGALS